MDSSLKSRLSRTPLEVFSENVFTSTPMIRSEYGKKLIRRQFVKNLPEDLALQELEVQLGGLKIAVQSPEVVKLFVFKKEDDPNSTIVRFHTPKLVSPETLEKYNQLFEQTPKLKRKRIRL